MQEVNQTNMKMPFTCISWPQAGNPSGHGNTQKFCAKLPNSFEGKHQEITKQHWVQCNLTFDYIFVKEEIGRIHCDVSLTSMVSNQRTNKIEFIR